MKVGDIVKLSRNGYAKVRQIEKKLNTRKAIWHLKTKYGWSFVDENQKVIGLEKEIIEDKLNEI